MIQNKKINFHIPFTTGKELNAINALVAQNSFSYPTRVHQQCIQYLQELQGNESTLLTGSCTAALEIAAFLSNIRPGDEIIIPSFAYPSMANAFALRGGKIVFVDIEPNSMNIDPKCVEAAITPHTKAIVVMHYGGVACDLNALFQILEDTGIYLIEDAAHCIGARYKGQALGTFGLFGTLSFHSTKNIHCTQGGALLIKDDQLFERALSVAEKGTDKYKMTKGVQAHYSWINLGSSYLMNSLSAAFLVSQLEMVETVNNYRLNLWNHYFICFQNRGLTNRLDLFKPSIDKQHNGHIFFIKCQDRSERQQLIKYLKSRRVQAYFHYLPLHVSKAGKKYGVFHGTELHTSKESERLLRLPLHIDLQFEDIEMIVDLISRFLKN